MADGGRADLFKSLLDSGDLPHIREHLVDRGCYRTALTVFPSTTGPAHIPFVSGIHPGTANVPGYRWLSRTAHDTRRRSFDRHRSLNTPRGLFLGRDMDPRRSTSLYEHFDKPSSVVELVDYCTNRKLYKVVFRRMFRVVRAHKTSDWQPMDRMVERLVIERIKAGSDCIIASFFAVDEYSHLYDPFDERTIEAYRDIDGAVGRISETLKAEGVYDETILAIVSDHGLTGTDVHIPVVDIVKQHGFDPFYYPKLHRRHNDSAVLESGNSMAMLYFKRGNCWGDSWLLPEMQADKRIGRLIDGLLDTKGVSFAIARTSDNGIAVIGREGVIRATRRNGEYLVTADGTPPLDGHPVGEFSPEELLRKTFDSTYPDAVNQAFMLFESERTGDLLLSSDPGYDLRLQHEDPEHHGSHGSLHREHMHVPLAISVPIEEKCVQNVDLVPTILALTGKETKHRFDGRTLSVNGHQPLGTPSETEAGSAPEDDQAEDKRGRWLSVAITVGIILMGIVITAIFKDDIFSFGQDLMTRYGQDTVDFILFALTAVSSSPLALPIWGYALVGVAMGYNVIHLALVMALGSATGSLVTFLLGRFFGNRDWVEQKFPNLHRHPWTHGRSRWMVTLFLFLGTASPLPCDVFYAACGLKRYPTALFWVTMVAARFVRYLYLGYGFDFFKNFM